MQRVSFVNSLFFAQTATTFLQSTAKTRSWSNDVFKVCANYENKGIRLDEGGGKRGEEIIFIISKVMWKRHCTYNNVSMVITRR